MVTQSTESQEKPVQLASLGSKVIDLSAGVEFSMICTEDGKVKIPKNLGCQLRLAWPCMHSQAVSLT